MKTGYPFLAISRKHNLDYGVVLKTADYIRKHQKDAFSDYGIKELAKHNITPQILKEIDDVNYEFAAMQAGIIQWQAGHEVKEAA